MTILTQGSVTDRPWGQTLGALGNRGLSGQVALVSDGKQYIVAFSQGVIVGAYSPLASDAAVRLALTSNLITSTQVNDITRRMAAAPNRDEIDLLAELVRLAPDQAARLRRRLVAQRAARTFSPDVGEFVVEDRVRIPVVPGGEIDVRTAIYLGAKTNLAEDRLVNELAQLGTYFELKPDTIEDLAQYGFTSPDKPVLDMLLEGAYVDEIIADNQSLGDRAVRAIVYSLASCGAFKLGAPPRVARAFTPSTAPTLQQPGRVREGAVTQQRMAVSRTTTPPVSRTTTPPVSRTTTPTPTSPPVSRTTTPPVSRTMTPAQPATARARTITGRNSPPGQPATPRTSTGSTLPPMSRTSTGSSVPTRAGETPHPMANPGSGAFPSPVESSAAIPQPVTPSPSPSHGIPRTVRPSPSPSGGIPRTVTPSSSPSAGVPRTVTPSSSPSAGVSRTVTPSSSPVSRTMTPSSSPSSGRSHPSSAPPTQVGPFDAPTGRKAPPPRRARANSSAVIEIEQLLQSKIPLLDAGADHFTLLGLSSDANTADIRSAYFTLARKLHPDRLAAIGIDDEERHAQRLMAQVNLAFAVLNDPVKREEYVSIMQRGGEAAVKAEESKADELAMRVMRAEEAFKQGEMALRREQLAKAIESFQMAVELQPREGEYQALLAWAQFAAAADKAKIAIETRKALLKASDANDRSPTAKFYLGRVERMLGREKEALQCFQDVLQIKPNHSEAASEVRILQQRLNKR